MKFSWFKRKSQQPAPVSREEMASWAHDVLKSSLENLGCQLQPQEDGTFNVDYQGEHFTLEIGGPYARVWDLNWAGINVADPNFGKLREAVNATNYNWGPTVLLTQPDNAGTVCLHSKHEVLLSPQMSDTNGYVASILNSFFQKKEEVRSEFHDLLQKTETVRRPVGFNTNASTSKNA